MNRLFIFFWRSIPVATHLRLGVLLNMVCLLLLRYYLLLLEKCTLMCVTFCSLIISCVNNDWYVLIRFLSFTDIDSWRLGLQDGITIIWAGKDIQWMNKLSNISHHWSNRQLRTMSEWAERKRNTSGFGNRPFPLQQLERQW